MGRGRATSSSSSCSSSSSSIDSSNHPAAHLSHSQFKQFKQLKRDLSTDLRLGLSISSSSAYSQQQQQQQQHNHPSASLAIEPLINEAMNSAEELADECNDDRTASTLYVKVYREGHAIGRKLNLLAHDGFHDLIRTLEHMFNTNILWGDEVDRVHCGHDLHVLTYEDEEGDWLIVGDVPWEMFLSAVKRLKITRTFPC